MYIKTALIGITVLGLVACATAPTTRFASSVKDAQAANRPLVIYQFATVNWLVGRGQYPSSPVYGTIAGLSFISTTQQPIHKIIFNISTDNRDGKAITGNLIAQGDFLPGNSYSVVNKFALWKVTSGHSCPRLTDVKVIYQDGSHVTATAPEAAQYLTPQINIHCAAYPYVAAYGSYPGSAFY